jgi:transcriptional regulator with XRE-family HTH domain
VTVLYKRIKDLREDNDFTQQALASYLNITQTTYSRYENGQLDIPTFALIKLSKLYQVSIDYLLDQTTSPATLNVLVQRKKM